MLMRKLGSTVRMSWIVVALLSMLLVVGCAPPAAAPAEAPETEAAEEIVLTIGAMEEKPRQFIDEYVIPEFEKMYPNIKVDITWYPDIGAVETFWKASFQSGETPDIGWMYEGAARVPLFAKEGFLVPLDDYIASDENFDVDAISQGLMRGGGTHDGVIYALPQEEGTVVWAWNLAVLDELGVGPPQTDTEFVEMCKLAAEKGIIVDPGWGFLSNWASIGLFKSQNTWSVAEDESGTTVSNVSDPAFTDAIKWFWDLVNVHECYPVSRIDATQTTDDVRKAEWKDNKSVMLWTKPSPELDELVGEGNWVATAPWTMKGKRIMQVGGTHMFISALAENPDAAWKFMSFYLDRDTQEVAGSQYSMPPNRRDLTDVFADDPYIGPTLEAMGGDVAVAPWEKVGFHDATGLFSYTWQPQILAEPDWDKALALLEEADAAVQAEIDKAYALE